MDGDRVGRLAGEGNRVGSLDQHHARPVRVSASEDGGGDGLEGRVVRGARQSRTRHREVLCRERGQRDRAAVDGPEGGHPPVLRTALDAVVGQQPVEAVLREGVRHGELRVVAQGTVVQGTVLVRRAVLGPEHGLGEQERGRASTVEDPEAGAASLLRPHRLHEPRPSCLRREHGGEQEVGDTEFRPRPHLVDRGRSQREVGRSRHHRGAPDLVVRDLRDLRGQPCLPVVHPGFDRGVEPGAEHQTRTGRVPGACLAIGTGQAWNREVLSLPGVRRKIRLATRAGAQRRASVDLGTGEMGGAERPQHDRAPVLVAAQRRDDRHPAPGVRGGLVDRAGEDRVRADLDEEGVAVVEQRPDTVRERRGLAQGVAPVRGVHAGAVDALVQHSRVDRDPAGGRPERAQLRPQLLRRAVRQNAAEAGDPQAVVQGECPARTRRRHLANAVADHHVRLHSPGPPQLGECHLDGEEQRLDGTVRLPVRRGGVQLLEERAAEQRRRLRVALAQHRREHRLLGQQAPGRAGPLRAGTGEDERGPGPAGRGLLGGPCGLRVAALGEPLQVGGQAGQIAPDRGKPIREGGGAGGEPIREGGAAGGGPADVRHGGLRRGRAQRAGRLSGVLEQRLRTPRGEGQQLRRPLVPHFRLPAERPQRRERVGESAARVAAPHGAECDRAAVIAGGGGCGLLGELPQRVQQHGMGGDLQEYRGAVGHRPAYGVVEPDQAAEVLREVGAVDLTPVERLRGDRGDQRDPPRARAQLADVAHQVLDDLLDRRAVSGHVDVDHAGLGAGGPGCGDQLFEPGAVAGDHGGTRPVARGHGHPVVVADEFVRLGRRVLQRGHAVVRAGHLVLVPAVVVDERRPLFHVEDSGDHGRRDLADAVSDHRGRAHAVVFQQAGQADLHGVQQRQDHVQALPGLRARGELLGQGPAGQRDEVAVALLDRGAEDRFRAHQLDAHLRVLVPVRGADEEDVRVRPVHRWGGGLPDRLRGACRGQFTERGLVTSFENDVHVRAAKAEGADSGERARVLRPCLVLARDAQAHSLEVDVRVRGFEVRVRRDLAVPQAERRLHQPRDARGAFEVADVRLHRTEDQVGRVLLTPHGEHRAEGRGLDRVAEHGTRAVRLDVRDLARVDRRRLVGPAEDFLLGDGVRRGQAVALSVVVGGRSPDHAPDPVVVGERARQGLEDDDAAALAPAEAVGALVEDLAPAVRRESAEALQRLRGPRVEEQVDPADDGDLRLPGGQALTGEVHGQQGGRTRGVDDQARTTQPEGVREAVGDHVQGAPARQVGRGRAVRRTQVGVVVPDGADEDAGGAAGEAAVAEPGGVQRLPGHFEEEGLLRIHLLRLARGDAEEQRVELVDRAAQIARFTRPRHGRSPPRRYRSGQVGAVTQQPPELIDVVSAREAAGHAHDGDGLAAHRHPRTLHRACGRRLRRRSAEQSRDQPLDRRAFPRERGRKLTAHKFAERLYESDGFERVESIGGEHDVVAQSSGIHAEPGG